MALRTTFLIVFAVSSFRKTTEASKFPRFVSLELSSVPIEDKCKVMLQKFSNSSSAFTKCANDYAKPIFMCRNCVHDFVNTRSYFNALEHAESEGINCKDLLTSQDKVEIIKATYDYIVSSEGLWAKGFCSSCYTKPLNHTSKLTQNTIKFFALYKTVTDCFLANPDKKNHTSSRKSEACIQCALDYYDLLNFYRENFLHQQFPYLDGICFDILDAMNVTQHKWGTGHYHCGRELKGNASLIGALLVVMMTPAIFYLLVRFGPGARRAQERVLTQRHISTILSRAQEISSSQVNSNGDDYEESRDCPTEPVPGPSSNLDSSDSD